MPFACRPLILLAAATLLPGPVLAAAKGKAEAKAVPHTTAEILAVTPDVLAGKLGDVSEAGQDEAAEIWACAKRQETESKLAQKDVKMILALNGWRRTLDHWQDTILEVAYFVNGGGSMWGHDSARNDATLEEFLAAHAQTLGKVVDEPGKPKELNLSAPVLTAIAKGIQSSKEDMNNPDADKQGEELKKQVQEAESALALELASLPDAETREAVIAWAKQSAGMITRL